MYLIPMDLLTLDRSSFKDIVLTLHNQLRGLHMTLTNSMEERSQFLALASHSETHQSIGQLDSRQALNVLLNVNGMCFTLAELL